MLRRRYFHRSLRTFFLHHGSNLRDNIPGFINNHRIANPHVEAGDFVECGLCGTAAVISPVGQINDHGKVTSFGSMDEMGPTLTKLRETLTGIQMGRIEAPEGYEYHEDGEEAADAETHEMGGSQTDAAASSEFFYSERPEVELTGINDTSEDYEYRSVVELFQEQVRRTPGKLAVVTPTSSITYARLDELSNRVANRLLFLGIGPEDVIMILLPRGIPAYVATLGVLKSGAAYTIAHVS